MNCIQMHANPHIFFQDRPVQLFISVDFIYYLIMSKKVNCDFILNPNHTS